MFNLSQKNFFFPLLTLEHSFVDKSITSVRILAQVDVEIKLQFLRVQRVWQVVNQRKYAIEHLPFCQSLVHHIHAPIILQEVRSDKQSPQVAVLYSLT